MRLVRLAASAFAFTGADAFLGGELPIVSFPGERSGHNHLTRQPANLRRGGVHKDPFSHTGIIQQVSAFPKNSGLRILSSDPR